MCDDWDQADHWAEGYASDTHSPFKGMDMLAEPEPRWPDWLREWERRVTPSHVNSVSMFTDVMKREFTESIRSTLQQGRRLLFGGDDTYTTPPAIKARVAARRAKRLEADVNRGWIGSEFSIPIRRRL